MSADVVIDPELGPLRWKERIECWEGAIHLSSGNAFELAVFARAHLVAERAITADARRAIARIRVGEDAYRSYACNELLEIHNSEWSEGSVVDATEFMCRLEPESVEVHESGYSEMHFRDGDLFWGHSVGVRIRPDGSFQEAVVEG
jgi:hypothetical protein